MKVNLARLVPQPLTAILMSGCALGALAWLWLGAPSNWTNTDLPLLPLALFLALAIVWGGLYPIHIRRSVKVNLTTVPLYLTAVLLPLSLAPICAGSAMLGMQLMTMKKKGNLPSDVATAASRWVVVVAMGAWIAHLSTTSKIEQALILIVTALVMFAGDAVTGSFEVAAITGEPPGRVMAAMIGEGGLVEGVQYLLGMLGAVAALQEIWALVLLVLPTGIVYVAFKNAKEMHESTIKLLENMADAVDLRDPCTGGHSRRVAELTAKLLRALNAFGPEATLIISAARVHDIGKIGIPDGILKKPGTLTPEEWLIMESHPNHGAELLARYPDFHRGMDFVRSHHERWNGTGYPRCAKGFDIPFGARVIAVVDAFDAMTSDRPYRPAMSVEQAIQNLIAGRGKQWDPTIVDGFVRTIAKHLERPEIAAQVTAGGFAPAE